jgi:hypothetical protein
MRYIKYLDEQPELLSPKPYLAGPGSSEPPQVILLPHSVQDPVHRRRDTSESVEDLCRGDKKPQLKTLLLENHKEDIRQLYVDQNLRLKDVIKVMEERGIQATYVIHS